MDLEVKYEVINTLIDFMNMNLLLHGGYYSNQQADKKQISTQVQPYLSEREHF